MFSLFWIIASIGATHIITATSIFQRLRNFLDRVSPNFFGLLFSCPTCMGFWVGVLLSIFCPLIQISEVFFNFDNANLNNFVLLFLHGCFTSCICWLVNLLTTYVDNVTTFIELKNEIIVENPLDVAKAILKEEQSRD